MNGQGGPDCISGQGKQWHSAKMSVTQTTHCVRPKIVTLFYRICYRAPQLTINISMGKENTFTLLSVSLIASSLQSIVLSSVLINNSGFKFFQLTGSIPKVGGLQNIEHAMCTPYICYKRFNKQCTCVANNNTIDKQFDLLINSINQF